MLIMGPKTDLVMFQHLEGLGPLIFKRSKANGFDLRPTYYVI